MVRVITSQEANICKDHGYTPETIREQGREIRVLIKNFKFGGKIGLFFSALVRSIGQIFTSRISQEKTQDQWKALGSGKITVQPPADFFETTDKTSGLGTVWCNL